MSQKNKRKIDVGFTETQRDTLCRLGLQSLLNSKYGPSIKMMWHRLVDNRVPIFFGCFLISSIVAGGMTMRLYIVEEHKNKYLAENAALQQELELCRSESLCHGDHKIIVDCETCNPNVSRVLEKLPEPKTEFVANKESSNSKNSVAEMSEAALAAFFEKASPMDLNGRHPVHGASLAHTLVSQSPDVSLLNAFLDGGGSLNQHRFSKTNGEWDKFKKGDTPLMLCIRKGDIYTTLKLLKHFTPEQNGMWRKNVHGRNAFEVFLNQRQKLKDSGVTEDQLDLALEIFTLAKR